MGLFAAGTQLPCRHVTAASPPKKKGPESRALFYASNSRLAIRILLVFVLLARLLARLLTGLLRILLALLLAGLLAWLLLILLRILLARLVVLVCHYCSPWMGVCQPFNENRFTLSWFLGKAGVPRVSLYLFRQLPLEWRCLLSRLQHVLGVN
jgi:hypothetical protein